MIRFFSVFLLVICLVTPAQAQLGIGGMFGFGDRMEIVKIGASARAVLKDYLAADYQHHCSGKSVPDACLPQKPYYTASALPQNADYRRIPDAVMRKIGFIEPGAVYMQIGFTVYLVKWPNRVIFDHVSYWDEDRN